MAAERPPPPKGFHYERVGHRMLLIRDTAPGTAFETAMKKSFETSMKSFETATKESQQHILGPVASIGRQILERRHVGCETCAEADRLIRRFTTAAPTEGGEST